MKKILFAVGTAYTSLLVLILVSIDQLIKQYMPIGSEHGLVFIAFVAWAVYFFSGCTVKGGIKAAIGYVVGVVFAILIMLLAGVISSIGFIAVPLAAMIVVFFVLYLEKVPWFDLLPASFVAAGCFFGIMTYIPDASFCSATFVELFYGALGLLFGQITITGKGFITKALEKK